MCDTAQQTKTEDQPPTLAEIVREVTDNGRTVINFLQDAMDGKLDGFQPCHRIAAARELAKRGDKKAIAFLQSFYPKPNGRNPNGSKPSPAGGEYLPDDELAPNRELAEIVREVTGNGRTIAHFLHDAMLGILDGFKPCHRVASAKELLHRGFDITHVDTATGDDDHEEAERHSVHRSEFVDPRTPEQRDPDNPNYVAPSPFLYHKEDDPFDFENYDREQYWLDGMGDRALRHIYGGKEAEKVAYKAVSDHRRKTFGDEDHIPDRDHTPIENPEDDPYGKGHYGYKALCVKFGDNQAIRAAGKAVAEYHRRKFRPFINENGSINSLVEIEALDPRALQYLERSRHLLANDAPQLTEDFKTVPAHEHPPTEHPQNPPDGTVPNTTSDLEHPSTEYQDDPPVGAVSRTAHDPTHPAIEHSHDPSSSVILNETSVILSEAEGSPTRDPDRPPGPRRRRKTPRRIHLGPPDEDPPDDNPRRNRHTGDIRIPLKNLHSTSPVPI